MLDGTELRAGETVTLHSHGQTTSCVFLGTGAKSQKVYLASLEHPYGVAAVALNSEHWIADPKTDRAYTFGDPEVLDSGTPDRE